ncbi:MAG: hypothetical protein HUU29_02790 [Planctomycetaceae bacterium]|nr:hypothetical protein [Planctomycetaceae bacterium]
MAQQKCPECEEGAPAWMLTFGDMTTLILTFFILLITMMVIDPKKYVEVLGVFANTSGDGYNKPTTEEPIPTEQYFIQIIRASSRRSPVPDGGMNPTVTGETPVVFSHKENYVAKIADTRFFAEYSVMLTRDAKIQMDKIAKLANEGGANRIRLIGHYSRSEAPSKFEKQAEEASTARGDKFSGRGLLCPFEVALVVDEKPVLESGDVWINDSEDLAYRRARAVLEYLAHKGVARQRMTAISGGMISDVKVASERQTWLSEKGWREAGQAEVHAGTAEASELSSPVVAEGVDEKGRPRIPMLRQWPHFIFTEGGDDRGRTVEIVMTGELVGVNEQFAPPVTR